VFSPQTAREVRAMLEMAVLPGGTAPKAQIPGYRVAGKTGTAHKLEGGRYANKYVSSFVGFAPASDPRLIVAVMIDEPSAGKHYGGDVAAPVFAAVMGGSCAPSALRRMRRWWLRRARRPRRRPNCEHLQADPRLRDTTPG
jgi:cell division protein FtsI (penicillin-binding protein 3)